MQKPTNQSNTDQHKETQNLPVVKQREDEIVKKWKIIYTRKTKQVKEDLQIPWTEKSSLTGKNKGNILLEICIIRDTVIAGKTTMKKKKIKPILRQNLSMGKRKKSRCIVEITHTHREYSIS